MELDNESHEFDPQAYIDDLVEHPDDLIDRIHNSVGGDGMLYAASLSRRLAGMDPDIAVERYVNIAVRVLSAQTPDPERLQTGVSTLIQLWDNFASQKTQQLIPLAIRFRMENLPSRAEMYHLTPQQAERVATRFKTLITPPTKH